MKYEDIQIGTTEEINHQLTSEDVSNFVELTGDDNRLHTDTDFAAKTSFKKPVAHGMLGASFISTLIGTRLPGDGALWFSQNLEFLLPVRVGDMLTIRAEVIKKDDRTKVIELQTDIINQHRQKVTKGVAKVKIVEQEQALVAEEAKDNDNTQNNVALVVGGSGGIGSATCLALAAAGFDVAIHYFSNVDSARSLANKIKNFGKRAQIFSCDITNQLAVEKVVDNVTQRLGSISVMVNCSTVKIASTKFSELVWDDFQAHLNNQILGAFNLVRAVAPDMEENRSGKIISLDTQYIDAPEPNLLPYITAKSALRGFNRSLAYDLAPKGIQVNSVSPGMTNTDQIADVPERVRLVAAANTPLRRLASPEDVAKVIVFLASDQSNFLCGEIIRVNGGQVMV